ncbi:DEAD/DEAH box helicase, partial [Fulvivirga sp. RKSG066]|uniref:helicase-related protein n=1 Tax=Fulvivirga aurantia TaxID=2529383 RepID=UPI0016237AA1
IKVVEAFENGSVRILIATDVIARGIDFDKVSHVINFDTPKYPENYMHRIGRTGRGDEKGEAILFYTQAEEEFKLQIEILMQKEIDELPFPEEIEINRELIPEERPRERQGSYGRSNKLKAKVPDAEKKEKNKKVNLGGSYKKKMAAKYKKPKTRGDKNRKKK